MNKKIIWIVLFALLAQSVFAIQQTFTGTVSNAADGDIVLSRVEGNNFITEVASNRYRISIEGNEGSEVEFWMKDHVIHRERLAVGVKPVDLDAATITPKPLSPDTEQPGIITTPPQDRLPASEKKAVSYFWIILFILLLAVIGGAIFYLQKNNWQFPFEIPKLNLPWIKKSEIKIPPRKTPLIPPRIPPRIPPKIQSTAPLKEGIKIPEQFEKPQELTPPKVNGAANALKDYISSMKEKGFDVKQIKAALYSRGWKKDLIDEAIS